MSKSLKRVRGHLAELDLKIDILEVTVPTNTAAQAAAALGCKVDQIVKSVIFLGLESGKTVLFLTSGNQRVDVALAADLAGEPLGKADAAVIRSQTGFAIGGVSPFGHLTPIRAFFDPHLLDFDVIWAAAGTPRHMFGIAPDLLAEKTGAHVAPFTDPLAK
jgi:prolyl-tRNA editing enzyme YbaK/EbsC (Cys-tRNA(Pro) deacylase)